MKPLNFDIVAAVASNGVIGNDGGIPWHLKEDLRFFRELTLEGDQPNVVIMGRKTWQSIPQKSRPLGGRFNVVVSQNPEGYGIEDEGGYVQNSLVGALGMARTLSPQGTVFIVGGQSLYQEALGKLWSSINLLHLTHVEGFYSGDTFFPFIDLNQGWDLITTKHPDSHAGGTPYRWSTYKPKDSLELLCKC